MSGTSYSVGINDAELETYSEMMERHSKEICDRQKRYNHYKAVFSISAMSCFCIYRNMYLGR